LAESDPNKLSNDEVVDLVKLFDTFSEASSTYTQSYRILEQRITQLSVQLRDQTRLLHHTEGFLSSVLGRVPVGILVIDMDGKIILFNSQAEQITGYHSDEVYGRLYSEIFPIQ